VLCFEDGAGGRNQGTLAAFRPAHDCYHLVSVGITTIYYSLEFFSQAIFPFSRLG